MAAQWDISGSVSLPDALYTLAARCGAESRYPSACCFPEGLWSHNLSAQVTCARLHPAVPCRASELAHSR